MERIDWKTYYKQRYVGFPQPVGVVFGEDNREKVEDAGVSPYNAILRLMLETEGTKARGTGFMIGQGLMLTAAHVMYDYKKKINRTVQVVGGDGNLYQVYKYIMDPHYKDICLPKYDWAVAAVSVVPGKTAPYLSIQNTDDADCPVLTGHEGEVAGYPASVRGTRIRDMYTEKGNIQNYSDTDKELRYRIDTSGGQSGSPVIIYKDGVPYAVGIHNSGTKGCNIGRAIDTEILTAVRELSNP